jgi:excisionase family DNA binding protein
VSPSMSAPDVLTVAEAAAELRVSAATLYRSLERGEIPSSAASKVGGQWRIRRGALLSYIFSTAEAAAVAS